MCKGHYFPLAHGIWYVAALAIFIYLTLEAVLDKLLEFVANYSVGHMSRMVYAFSADKSGHIKRDCSYLHGGTGALGSVHKLNRPLVTRVRVQKQITFQMVHLDQHNSLRNLAQAYDGGHNQGSKLGVNYDTIGSFSYTRYGNKYVE